MHPQVEKVLPHLKPGGVYKFTHRVKGVFYAKFLGFHDNAPDEVDPYMLDLAIWTGPGSAQERLAFAYGRDLHGNKVAPLYTGLLCRPSKLTDIFAPGQAESQRVLESMTASRVRFHAEAEVGPPATVHPLDEVPVEPKRSLWDRVKEII